MKWILLLFWIYLFTFQVLSSSQFQKYIAHSYEANSSFPLIHLTLNQRDGLVYISAVNRLYQLNKNLEKSSLIEVKMGPVNDSKNCQPFLACEGDVVIKPFDNYNKMLLMDQDRDRIIVCGSVYQGICETRSLRNIGDILSNNRCDGKPCDYEFIVSDNVACNTKDCSTLGVIAEGPTVFNPVLYVATTVTDSRYSLGRSISTRSLHIDPSRENLLFRLAVEPKGKKISAAPLNEEKYLKKTFKYAFSMDGEDGFVYFLFQKITTTKSTSVIARVCKKDPLYSSYIEMNLTCAGVPYDKNTVVGAYYVKDVGGNFPLQNTSEGVLYTLFSNGVNSSLCLFTIEDLNQAFDDTLISCFKYQGKDGPGSEIVIADRIDPKPDSMCDSLTWISPDETLDNTVIRAHETEQLSYYKNYTIPKGKIRCGAIYLPSQIKRVTPVPASWSYTHQGVNFSAVTVHLIGNISVAYIGTTDGKIIELNINKKEPYNVLNVGHPILSDLILDEDPSLSVPHLYAMTPSKVFHITVSVCEQHKTCSACLEANDPYCGWCILKSRCMAVANDCPTNSWLKPLSEQCIHASIPEPMERTLEGNVQTTVDLLPALTAGDSYECVFNGKYNVTASVSPEDGATVTCKAPPSNFLPQNLKGKDFVHVTLSIRYNRTTDIVSTVVTFYECFAHGSSLDVLQPCQSCLTSEWTNKCTWCIGDHSCLPQENRTCTNKSSQCPQVVTAMDDSKLLSVGLPRPITLQVRHLPTSGAEYKCEIMIEGNDEKFTVPATRSEAGDQVVCAEKAYSYTKAETEVPANVTVYWKSDYVVDTGVFNITSFYNCSVTYDDCSLCVTSNPSYSCGWCGSKSQCTIEQMCQDEWITDPQQCPDPEITSFAPTSGPIDGQTLVTIFGINMGVDPSDVRSVTVAGIPCMLRQDLYKVSKEIACLTGSAGSPTSGKIEVKVRGVTKTSIMDFQFRNPTLEKLLNTTGPVSGGTTITIVGQNMDTGFSKTVFIGSTPCEVVESDDPSSRIDCRTNPASAALNLTVSVQFDSYMALLPNAFGYLPDPKIKHYSTPDPGHFASFLAGGRNITFTGERLNLVQHAELIALVDVTDVSNTVMQQLEKSRRKRSLLRRTVRQIVRQQSFFRRKRSTKSVIRQFSSPCTEWNSTTMICPSPKVSLTIGDNITRNISDTMFVTSSLKLYMDNLKVTLDGAKLKYYPNPLVQPLNEQDMKKEWRSDNFLKVTVLNLNRQAITKEEIIVNIGSEKCNVSSMDETGLLCTVPEKPEGTKSEFPVEVVMGNKNWTIGTIKYFVKPPLISEPLMYGLIVIGVIIAVVAVVMIWYCVKKNKHYKENKNEFQKVIENLEMSVRADFRKAFAELSIDMTDLTSDIGDVGLPILRYRQYATNMFFPSLRYHHCMKEPDPTEKPIQVVEQGLTQFSLLITNKHFLISFVKTLEQQRGFSNRDKGNVASLITVVLHKKLDYFTEVMKSLISDLVAQSVQRNPKLVLRRTESVAERMFSNWMAICLFPYIRDKAGKPLFLLQKAIKHQVSKGALDAVTGKARYTLSDDRLLKEDVPSEPLTLFVSQSGSHDDEPVIVKVLSCDSIAQVKEKVMDAVYKRIPFSHRPKADQLDLEWRHGRSGHLVLPDIDYANEPGSRWRRVMTIKDYKVENNATMALIQRQQAMYGSQDIVTAYASQSPDTSVVSPMLPEESAKVYHLVKYTDDLEQKRESTIPRDRHKHILDLYLLRLINMKGILQSYVDEVFQAILDTSSIPPAVKHFFDFLDELAKTHGIDDPEIRHIWKTNSVLGRFWVTILKNPESVFDIDKPETVESSMSVISQTFIDACSVQEHKPTKDSPINKQLYAKEIPTYKKMVQKYYQDVHDMQPVSDQDMCAHMAEISRSHDIDFDVHVANNELWGYVNKYYEEIQETLSNDENTTQMVIQRLQQAYTLIDSSVNNP